MQVNYVREHERFIEYAADERVPANVQLLWYALMHIFNQRAEGNEWPDGFIRITNDRLFTYLPIKWDAMAKARNALKQMGRIDFRNGSRNKTAPEYRIIPFYPSCCPFKTDNTGGNTGGNEGGNTGGNARGNPGDISININESYTKPDMDNDDDEEGDLPRAREDAGDPVADRDERATRIREAFRAGFGRMPYPAETDRLVSAGWRMKMPPEMVALAIRTAAGFGASSPADYAIEVLMTWMRNEVRQPHQVEEYNAEFLSGRDDFNGMNAAVDRRRDENARMMKVPS